MPRSDAKRQRGFTLIEAVMVIVITGVLVVVVAVFVVPATTAYLASSARAQLLDQADTALRRIGRDIAIALPNSARISNGASSSTLELIPTSGAARYAVEGADPLQFGTPDSSFNIVGPPLALGTAQALVFYNLGAGNPDADAYTQSNLRIAGNGAGNAGSISLSGAALPTGLFAAPYRFYAVGPPVSYRCDTGTGKLTRYWGYGFLAVQPDPPSGGNSAVLATGVSACQFTYETAIVAARAALLTLRLSLSGNGETVTLYHALHVDNLP